MNPALQENSHFKYFYCAYSSIFLQRVRPKQKTKKLEWSILSVLSMSAAQCEPTNAF